MNELKTVFVFESGDGDRRIDLTRKNLFALNNDFNNLGKNLSLSQTLGKQVKQSDSLLQVAQADIKRYQQQTLKGEQDLTRLLDRQAEQRFQNQSKQLQKGAAEFQKVLNQNKQTASKVSGIGGDVLGGLGVPLGLGAAVGLGATVLKSAASAAFDAERANRQLSASATQAGLSYQFLAEKAKGFADEGGLSQTNANRTEGLIAKLAQATGRPKDLDKIETALLDTASARGLQVSQLETLVNAVISGSSDEPLNAVGLSDPGKLAKDYAEKLGKSTEALTKQEQVLSRFLPLMQQADSVTGANADRMKSLSGQAETASARIDDLTTNFGNSLVNTLEFRDALGLLNGVLKELTANPYEIRIKLKNGETPKQIAEEEANKTGNQVLDFVKSALSFPLANVAYVADVATEGFEVANNRYIETITGAKDRRIRALTELFEGENKLIQNQNKAAEKQKSFLNLQTFEDQDKSRIEQEKKNLEKRRKEFDNRFSNLSGLDDINQNRQLLNELRANQDLFSPEEFTKRIYETQQKINDEIKKGKEKVIELGKVYTGTFDSLFVRANSNNPFVSLFSEADKSLKTLRENTKGLSADLISTFEQMESKAQSLKLFETRIDNNLSVFDLRERANALRGGNESSLKIDNPNKFFEDYIEFYANKLEADFQKRGGGATRFNLTGAGGETFGFSQSNERRGVRYNSNIFTGADGKQYTNGFSQSWENPLIRYNSNIFTDADGKQYTNGFSQSRLTFADLTESEKRAYVERSSKSEINLSLNDRLERQRAIIYDGAFSEDQKALADRKFLALTSGIDSKELSGRNRETLALTAERQAERQEKYQREALAVEKEKLVVQKTIAENGRRLIEIAEKDGFKAIENVIRFVDDTTSGVTPELQPAATARDTQKAYDDGYKGGTFYEESQK